MISHMQLDLFFMEMHVIKSKKYSVHFICCFYFTLNA